jgi:hypothetical protein
VGDAHTIVALPAKSSPIHWLRGKRLAFTSPRVQPQTNRWEMRPGAAPSPVFWGPATRPATHPAVTDGHAVQSTAGRFQAGIPTPAACASDCSRDANSTRKHVTAMQPRVVEESRDRRKPLRQWVCCQPPALSVSTEGVECSFFPCVGCTLAAHPVSAIDESPTIQDGATFPACSILTHLTYLPASPCSGELMVVLWNKSACPLRNLNPQPLNCAGDMAI